MLFPQINSHFYAKSAQAPLIARAKNPLFMTIEPALCLKSPKKFREKLISFLYRLLPHPTDKPVILAVYTKLIANCDESITVCACRNCSIDVKIDRHQLLTLKRVQARD
jgi:hypothetical protein